MAAFRSWSQRTRPVIFIFLVLFTLVTYKNFERISYVLQYNIPVQPDGVIMLQYGKDVRREPGNPENSGKCGEPRLTYEVPRILWWSSFYGAPTKNNQQLKCGKFMCELTSNRSLLETSHVVLFHGWKSDMRANTTIIKGVKHYTPINLPPVRYPDQYWLLFMLESPYNWREHMRSYEAVFNWTMTYRTGSDIFLPYGKFRPLDKPKDYNKTDLLPKTKTKLVGWILSNCRNVATKRLDLVKKLQEHVPVDIYGKCGPLKCKTGSCKTEISSHYKFYLALENSPCQDYITEKAFHTMQVGMVPIVYGSANYDLFLPRGSYINVNSFPSAKALANYLLYLDKNDDEYLKYFEWRRTMRLVENTYNFGAGYCNICRKIHTDYPGRISKVYPNMTEWLFGSVNSYRVCNEPLIWE